MFVCVSGGGCNGNIYGKREGFGKKELICEREREGDGESKLFGY